MDYFRPGKKYISTTFVTPCVSIATVLSQQPPMITGDHSELMLQNWDIKVVYLDKF